MKASQFNFFFNRPEEDGYLAYNSHTNSLALMEAQNYDKFQAYIKRGEKIDDAKLVDDLKKGGFLLDDDYDEMQALRYSLYRSRFQTSSMGLTIAPTGDCNFRCVYCYEKNAINCLYMSEETENYIVQFVEERAPRLTNLNITWYGGEPLMAIGTIERLSKRFLEVCEKNNVTYSAGIVTNGYLLTPENWETLKCAQISHLQVTIDGGEKTHNKRRFLEGGGSTYQTIMENLESIKDEHIPVSLRINVDKTNINETAELLDDLAARDLLKAVVPYLGKSGEYGILLYR